MKIRTLILLSAVALILLSAAPKQIERIFSLPAGSVSYYQGTSMGENDYSTALEIKAELEKKGAYIYAMSIADLSAHEGNEIIALYKETRDIMKVYSSSGECLYSFKAALFFDSKMANIELQEYSDARGPLKVLKLYVLREKANERNVEQYMFQIREKKIKYVTQILFFSERRQRSGRYHAVYLENTFADVDGNGELELLVAQKNITPDSSSVAYQLYKYDARHSVYNYVPPVGGFESPGSMPDYGRFFKGE